MTQTKLSVMNEPGAYTATQRGALLPNGELLWGDPNRENYVIIPQLKGDARVPAAGYYLDRETGDYSVVAMRQALGRKLAGAGLNERFEDYPEVVKRTLVLAIGELEQD